MTEAGPAAKRPPHMLLEAGLRVLIALLLLGPAALGLAGCDRQSGNAGQPAAANQAAAPTSGEVQGGAKTSENGFSFRIDRSQKGQAAPDFAFTSLDGQDRKLKDFAGKPLLVNLWATWCGPCVAEMPTLDTLAGKHKDLVVLALSQDSDGAAKVAPWFAKAKLKNFQTWLDPENQFGFHYATGLLPTTVLYDAKGKEVARVIGAMDWEGDTADKLIAETIG